MAAILVAVVLVAGCGSSRKALRRDFSPDAAASELSGHTAATAVTADTMSAARQAADATTPLTPLQQELTDILADSVLMFSQMAVRIVDITDGRVVFDHRSCQRMRPASTEKVVTAIAALDKLGPNYQFATRLLTTAQLDADGTLRGDLYVRGGMDPLLTAADVRSLAQQLRAAGVRQVRGRLLADATMKDGDELGWGWCWDDENPVLSPMLVGGKPSLMTALENALRGAGVKVTVPVSGRGQAPAEARELAAVRRPLLEVMTPMMKESDNLCAESVFYQLAPTRTKAASLIATTLIAASNVADSLLATADVRPAASAPRIVIADGSGLSLYNYHTARSFADLLTYAAARPDSILTTLLSVMPVAATDGTLRRRMAGTTAAGNVRAKTGSVTAVSSLVGYATQRSTGHLMAFAIINNGVETMAQGRTLQDRICVALSR